MNIEAVTNEIKLVASRISNQKLWVITENAFKEAFKMTFIHKYYAFKFFLAASYKALKALAKYFKESFQAKGIKGILIEAPIRAKNKAVEKINQFWKDWKSMDEKERFDKLLGYVVFGISAVITGGGFDFEGGIPDTDIKLGGIGSHRNLLSHTIIIGFISEFAIRFVTQLAVEAEKEEIAENLPFIKLLAEFSRKYQDYLVNGMWFGLFVHFLKDSKIFSSSRTKPYVGLKNLTVKQHKQIFAANAFTSMAFSVGKANHNKRLKSSS
ncbi:hypothetical protein [Pseudothermotoga thermarum]|uniref:Uncharacterized protein n=1 Tax=Pseudothermotoga thermarum DSM 5069 TaxID=688269 RepID=F7YX86_9THEM|nr:hypothetical protein [Pseudothermotoga thermarum]AEH51223.1 hypothetical protein Theth_1148 [Pseudothermotoga thermarum DSM 5069]